MSANTTTWPRKALRFLAALVAMGLAGIVSMAILVAISLCLIYPNLPDVTGLLDYRPKLPLRVYSSEGALLGEFGEERRNLTQINDIPAIMKDALLAIEDVRFYQHNGVDYKGLARAVVTNLRDFRRSQGSSTITMQVARNVYLSSEKTYTRKIYELLLTFKLEHLLTKDQILEIYMNHIYLGQRAYGFAAASEIYFGKKLKDITVAEAAMLAGLPQAPSRNNPISNPNRSRTRQLYIIDRMQEAGFITAEQAQQARQEPLHLRTASVIRSDDKSRIHAEYVAEMVRQIIVDQYGDDAYTRGLNVYTTINAADQTAAYAALRKGILNYEQRQFFRGPENARSIPTLPNDPEQRDDVVSDLLEKYPDNGTLVSVVVIEASASKIRAMRANGDIIEITGKGLKPVESGLRNNAPDNLRIRPGAVIRVTQSGNDDQASWTATQLPEVEGAFIAIDSFSGAIKALIGGFDFEKNKFNHATQAWRQPGSSFKPFIYSAALEKGYMPTTIVNDAPIYISAAETGASKDWAPKNNDGTFMGPVPLYQALAKSRNMVSIRLLQAIDPRYAQEWATRFGFGADKHPAYLTMALGAGSVTPMQMATAYAAFANGGYLITPWLITRVTDQSGRVLSETPPPVLSENQRTIPARNAFVAGTLLRSSVPAGASSVLKRGDLYGKTGTTNDAMDTWFAGYQPSLTAVAWVGYDTPRSLGRREYGISLSYPIWLDFMAVALKGVPVAQPPPPQGVVNVDGFWYYSEYSVGRGITSLGLDDISGTTGATSVMPPAPEERNRILDLFRSR